ncbi:MAG: PAS domain-containing protein, partial [Caldilineaceae bacterium]|nr:PAS domain-containing protein [Caldilineaceae bacterium]
TSPSEPAQPPADAETITGADAAPIVQELSVVGLGASAGGLTALRAFFSALPSDTGMTFVVVVHLLPEHESMLAELLEPYTGMPVMQVTERVKMQPNHIYVIPPAKRLLVNEGSLELADFDMPPGKRLQIDTFFRSLAQHHGDGGAIILSGTGSDGAVGIQSIKERGGLVLVQDPAEAEFSDMPKSAINTGLVDIVAPVAELAEQLVAAKRTRAGLEVPTDPDELNATAGQTLFQILAHLRVRRGHDFTAYKRGTVLRRIARRMQLCNVQTLTGYLQRLRDDGDEADALYRDLLIHVTEFFRDPEAWQELERTVIPHLFEGKGSGDHLRVWTVGCATGEEAYSIGILLLEYAATLPQPPHIQIFASDLGELALEHARIGVYPQAIATTVSEERLARFFTEDKNHYHVRDSLREVVLFTPHNLLQDPPFSHLDLVLCRNLLIYLQRDVQERIFESFHYALRPDGYIFLGSAETADSADALFEAINREHRIYRRKHVEGALILPTFPVGASLRRVQPRDLPQQPHAPAAPTPGEEHHLLLEEMAPPSLLVDQEYTVLHLSETVGRYLQHPGGTLSSDVTLLVRPELRSEVSATLARAFLTGHMVRSQAVPVQFNGTPHPVSVLVHPTSTTYPRRALVLFLEEEPLESSETGGADADAPEFGQARYTRVEDELRLTRQRLQTIREEYESTVEQLRAANEELASTNEEYRSTLEELETSKEELQSMNEELRTVNQEMKHRVEQTAQANSDLQNLLAATEIATLFLDRELQIQRYTPAAADLFNLMPPDQGRPIGHLRSNLAYQELEEDARQVLRSLVPVERDVQSEDGRWLQVTVRPYRTIEDSIDGIVITFVDITANKETELTVRGAKEYAESIVHALPNALLVLEIDLRVRTANDSFYRIFKVDPRETEGRLIYDLGDGQWDIPELRTLLEQILPENKVFTGYEVEHEFQGIGRRTMLLNGRRLNYMPLILLAITDITERKRAEEELQQMADTLEEQVQQRTEEVRRLVTELTMSEQAERRRISTILHDDLQQRLYGIQYQLASLREDAQGDKQAAMRAATDAITQSVNAAIATTRSLSVDLSPPVLYDEGLAEAVHWLAAQMKQQHGLKVEVQAQTEEQMLSADLRVLLFQIVRELLFNVVKHAGVAEAVVALARVDGSIRVEVADQGQGFDVAKSTQT